MSRPRAFQLVRDEDVSGVSGTGVVAAGVEFYPGGPVALRWTSDWPTSVVFHDRGVESVEAIHGHQGRTRIRWCDAPAKGAVREIVAILDHYQPDWRDRGGDFMRAVDWTCDQLGECGVYIDKLEAEVERLRAQVAELLPVAVEGCKEVDGDGWNYYPGDPELAARIHAGEFGEVQS